MKTRRNRAKIPLVGLVAMLGSFLQSYALATNRTVTSTADNGPGTLRDIMTASASGDTIDFSVTGTIVLTGSPIAVKAGVTINGPGPSVLAVARTGDPVLGIFTHGSAAATISGLAIENGRGIPGGGGINNSGTLTVNNCELRRNAAGHDPNFGYGAGVFNSGQITINNCTFESNGIFNGHGGAIYNDVGGTLVVTNSTFAYNEADAGSGIYNNGRTSNCASVFNCTFFTNYGSLIHTDNLSSTLLRSTILASTPDLANGGNGTVVSQGYNLSSGNGAGLLTFTGDQINTAPQLDNAGLLQNGGPTRTIALTAGSPAIDKGKSFALTTDQRGFARIVNNPGIVNASGGDACDIGAYEAPLDPLASSPAVNTNVDHDDGVCGAADCTLREAISRANQFANGGGSSNIVFAPGMTGVITLGGSELVLLGGVNIIGPGARALTVNANGQSRILSVLGGNSSISGLTLHGGFVSGPSGSSNVGGGVYVETALTLNDCVLTHNRVLGGSAVFGSGGDGGMARGGAIFNGGTLTLNRCTIGGPDSNTSNGAFGGAGGAHPNDGEILYTGGKGGPGFGGAIYNDSNASLTINNCTLTGNNAAGGVGGDAYHGGAGGEAVGGVYNLKNMTVTASTISGNSGFGGAGGDSQIGANGAAGRGVGGLSHKGGTSTIRNTIVAGNARNQGGGPDVDGAFTSSGFNLIGISNGGSGFTGMSDQAGTLASPLNPMLGPVQNNGGPTDTMALLNGSPALDQGFAFGNSVDQRSQMRPKDNPATANAPGGDGSDIGAFEADTNVVGPSPTPTATATPTATPTPTVPPSPSPSPTASRHLLNIATRLRVQTGDNVLIGGFIITGSDQKQVIIRGIGPSLAQFFTEPLSDPTLELYQGDTLLASNNNWKESQAEIESTGFQPAHDLESAIVRTLIPGNYTAIVRGNGNSTGIGVVEAYDLSPSANSKLANIATRGFVDTGDNVMIGGFITGADAQVVIRAIGPSLGNFGISGALQDPTLELVNSNGGIIRSNNDWKESQQSEISSAGLQPGDVRESALIESLPAGSYTAIVRGLGNSTGVGLVEIYDFH